MTKRLLFCLIFSITPARPQIDKALFERAIETGLLEFRSYGETVKNEHDAKRVSMYIGWVVLATYFNEASLYCPTIKAKIHKNKPQFDELCTHCDGLLKQVDQPESDNCYIVACAAIVCRTITHSTP
jgi:hypothetical protein